MASTRRLLFVVIDGHYFCSHRLALAKAAQKEGFEIFVACDAGKYANSILSEGFHLLPLKYPRRGMNVLNEWNFLKQLIQAIKQSKPDIIHAISLRVSLWVSLAAFWTRVPARIYTITGLGHLFTTKTIKSKGVSQVLLRILKLFWKHKNTQVIVQNQEDYDLFERVTPPKKLNVILGSGVDQRYFSSNAQSAPDRLQRVVMMSRAIREKGVLEFIEAAKLLKQWQVPCRMIIVGDVYPANPSSLTQAEMHEFHRQGIIEWWGFRSDILNVLRETDIAVLPSYREGLPKSLLEAAACGLPIVTTDVPGCRQVVENGVNGFLVPAKKSEPLAEAIQTLVASPDLRQQFGQKSRERVEKYFTLDMINQQTIAIYNQLLKRG